MNTDRETNKEQHALWNSTAGEAWIDAQATLDRMLAPFEDLLVEAVAAAAPRAVLDIGCGTGSTTMAVARRLVGEGRAVGVDISAPMIDVARSRAAREGVPATFIAADAQTYPFEPSSFDIVISRFGVMFFEDPVEAFSNLRRAARGGAPLRFVAWRSPEENPFMTAAERAARPFLPSLPPRRPDAPGQFGFADASRVHRILEESGWTEIDIQPIDVPCTFPARELQRYITRLGPVGQILGNADEQTRARIIDAMRDAFAPYVHGDEVRLDTACWTVGALAPGARAPAAVR